MVLSMMKMLPYDPGSISLVALLFLIRCHVMVGAGMAEAEHVNSAVLPTVTTMFSGISVNFGFPTNRKLIARLENLLQHINQFLCNIDMSG